MILPGTIFGQAKFAAARRASGFVEKRWDRNASNGPFLLGVLYGGTTAEKTNQELEVFAYKLSRNKRVSLSYMAGR